MSRIGSKDTKPEIIVRSLLHRMGYRFRLHRKDLPGNPDILLPKLRIALFVNGCYWHGHEPCHLFRLPKTRTEFWAKKIRKNRERDCLNYLALQKLGWKTVVVWECAVSKRRRLTEIDLAQSLFKAVCSQKTFLEIHGKCDAG